jgi:DNA-binding transcriptional LysR family regulator
MLDVRRLVLLRELAARGTIAAVAQALAYTPSAVSQQLRQLEREAGVTLLERAGRSVRLTDAAQLLVVHTDALVTRLELAEAELEALAETPGGTVSVATFQSPALFLLMPALRRLAVTHPRLEVRVVDAEPEAALPALALGSFDLVLADEYDGLARGPDPRLAREDLLHERILAVLPAGHRLAAPGGPVALAELADASWAATRAGSHHAEMLVRTCRALGGFEPLLAHRSNDLLLLLALVGSAGAVTLLPELVPTGSDPAVVARPLAEGGVGRTVFSAVRAGSERRPALEALRAALRAVAAAR